MPREQLLPKDSNSSHPKFVILLQDDLLQRNSFLQVCNLKHPKTGVCSTWFYSVLSYNVYEVTKFQENFRSWFIGDWLIKDDGLFIITQVNLIYLFLPLLRKHSNKFMDIQSLLDDEDFPDNKKFEDKFKSAIKLICETKEIGHKEFYKYNKEQTLSWLKSKVDRIIKVLKELDMNVSTSGSTISSFVKCRNKSNSTEDEYSLYACNLVSEYLEQDLSCELLKNLNIQEEPKIILCDSIEPPSKKFKKDDLAPLEDYSSKITHTAVKAENLTLSQKRFSKVDKQGLKSISSFFIVPLKK